MFGTAALITRASGCRVWDPDGREYVDYVMALGAVGLGYGHPTVNRAAEAAIDAGVVGPLPPVAEGALADALAQRIPWLEPAPFLKTGAHALAEPAREWLDMLRAETLRTGAVLIFDEIKTGFRLAIGGAVARYDIPPPDLVVFGKALANGFPLALVGGRADLMNAASRTWISST